MHIRRMAPKEADHVASLVRTAARDGSLAKIDEQRRRLESMDVNMINRLNKRLFGVHVAEHEGALVGVGVYSTAGECLLYFTGEHRGNGNGKQMLDAMMRPVLHAGDAFVIEASAKAAPYFQKNGLTVIGHNDDHDEKLFIMAPPDYRPVRESSGGWVLPAA